MTTVPADSSAALARDAVAPTQPPVDVGERALALLRLVARQWRTIFLAGILGAGGVAARQLLKPRTYTSSASLVLQGGRSSPSLSGLASQFGIALPSGGGDPTQSPTLYVEVLRSRTVLGAVARESYCDPCVPGAPRVPLSTLLDIPRGDTGAVADASVRRLSQMIAGGANVRTGIVTISATGRSAALAQQMATHALEALTRFNLQARQGQASAERRFTEGRVQDIAAELRAAEQRLKSFRESNRYIAQAPELELREAQLQREVRRYEEVYSALARTLEQSKIDEVRDTPAIVVIDPPSFPYRGDPRGTLFKAIFGGVVGTVLAAAVIAVLAVRRGALAT